MTKEEIDKIIERNMCLGAYDAIIAVANAFETEPDVHFTGKTVGDVLRQAGIKVLAEYNLTGEPDTPMLIGKIIATDPKALFTRKPRESQK